MGSGARGSRSTRCRKHQLIRLHRNRPARFALFVGGAAGGGVFDADGNALYTFNPSGLDGPGVSAQARGVAPAHHLLPETSPPTIVAGITEGGPARAFT
jgi:hypothetical protein